MDDDLLIKYILEEATPEENGQVQQWLATDAANRVRFQRLQNVWQLAAQSGGQLVSDTPQALQRLKQTLKARQTAPVRRMWMRAGAAAAAMAGVAGLALGAYVLIKPQGPAVKEKPPVVKPGRVPRQQMREDKVPAMPLPADTIPIVKPHKKALPTRVKPVPPERTIKKPPQQPTKPVDAKPVKKTRPIESALPPKPPVKKIKPESEASLVPVKKNKPDPSLILFKKNKPDSKPESSLLPVKKYKNDPKPESPPAPVKKFKSAPKPKAPPDPVKEPPIPDTFPI